MGPVGEGPACGGWAAVGTVTASKEA
jgi:hypothetical protein